ncbi:MAG: RecQ family ATP-dependent DNA helicase [archaeon]|nr:RecQ family ATP-dependent DNA helicase [archaeon]
MSRLRDLIEQFSSPETSPIASSPRSRRRLPFGRRRPKKEDGNDNDDDEEGAVEKGGKVERRRAETEAEEKPLPFALEISQPGFAPARKRSRMTQSMDSLASTDPSRDHQELFGRWQGQRHENFVAMRLRGGYKAGARQPKKMRGSRFGEGQREDRLGVDSVHPLGLNDDEEDEEEKAESQPGEETGGGESQADGDKELNGESLAGPSKPTTAEMVVGLWGSEALHALLDKLYGFPAFREGQLEVIQRVAQGQSTLAVLATGMGKSLCYQLPTYLNKQAGLGMTIVVSPLISLMEDQLAQLPRWLKGERLKSDMPPAQRARVFERAVNGQVDVLFISPERLASSTRQFARLAEAQRIGLVCIDEAHCITLWSHNFRVSYLQLGKALEMLLSRSRCRLALTATATFATRQAIARALCIGHDGIVCVPHVRDNLKMGVALVPRHRRTDALLKLLRSEPYSSFSSLIVYCPFKADVDSVTSYLSSQGLQVSSYHAGLTASLRARAQSAFMAGDVRIMVATEAFGMGINKADIRAVIHFAPPRSVEQYVQEVGRAGRDGLPSACHLMFSEEDYPLLRRFVLSDCIDPSQVAQILTKVFQPLKRKPTQQPQPSELGDDDDRRLPAASTPSSSYEIGLSKSDMEQQLDMKESLIVTIVAHMELEFGSTRYFELLPDAFRRCRITFLGKRPSEIPTDHPLLALIAQQALRSSRDGVVLELFDVAQAQGTSIFDTISALRSVAGPHRLDISFLDPCITCRVHELPSKPLQEEFLAQFKSKCQGFEASFWAKVNSMFDLLFAAHALQPGQEDPSAFIHQRLRGYFEEPSQPDPAPLSNAHLANLTSLPPVIMGDLKILFSALKAEFEHDQSIVRLIMGVSSPKFDANQQRKHPYWGRITSVDPYLLLQAIRTLRLRSNP